MLPGSVPSSQVAASKPKLQQSSLPRRNPPFASSSRPFESGSKHPWRHKTNTYLQERHTVELGKPASVSIQQYIKTVHRPFEAGIKGLASEFHDCFDLGDFIGEGSYGKVHVATSIPTRKQHAVKILPKHGKKRTTEQNLALIGGEINAWLSVQGCKHVARLDGVYEDEEHVYIVQELCLGGDLKAFLQEHGSLSEHEAMKIVRAVLEVIAECHAQGICYGDVKPANFLLKHAYLPAHHQRAPGGGAAEELEVRVVDFGCSQLTNSIRRRSGTPLYCAPEMFTTSHGRPADVWAVGVVMYQLLTGRLPFWDLDFNKIQSLAPHVVVSGIQHNEIRIGSRYGMSISPDAEDLLRRLLERCPQSRITAHEALSHTWLQLPAVADTLPPSADVFLGDPDSVAVPSHLAAADSFLDSSLGSEQEFFGGFPHAMGEAMGEGERWLALVVPEDMMAVGQDNQPERGGIRSVLEADLRDVTVSGEGLKGAGKLQQRKQQEAGQSVLLGSVNNVVRLSHTLLAGARRRGTDTAGTAETGKSSEDGNTLRLSLEH